MLKRFFFFCKNFGRFTTPLFIISLTLLSHLKKKKQLDFYYSNISKKNKNKIYFRVKTNPIWKAIWADNTSFDEVLISKRMVQDHMPDNVLSALTQVRILKDFFQDTLNF